MTVITPSLPGRESLLEECRASVAAQTVPVHHLVQLDEDRAGPQVVRNALAGRARTPWIFPVDDDDLLDPSCVETLLANAEGADVVYSWCRMDGRDDWVPNRLFNAKTLMRRNFIPVTALISKDMFDIVGGYRKVQLEDWVLYQMILLHGGRFRCVPEVRWTYRFGVNQFQPVPQAA